jgi:hypothetical protein
MLLLNKYFTRVIKLFKFLRHHFTPTGQGDIASQAMWYSILTIRVYRLSKARRTDRQKYQIS